MSSNRVINEFGVEGNPNASLHDIVQHFAVSWQNRVNFWQDYVEGRLSKDAYDGPNHMNTARDNLRVAIETRDGWQRRLNDVR